MERQKIANLSFSNFNDNRLLTLIFNVGTNIQFLLLTKRKTKKLPRNILNTQDQKYNGNEKRNNYFPKK